MSVRADDLVAKLSKAGVTLFLWKGVVRWDPKFRLGKNAALEMSANLVDVKKLLVKRAVEERSKPKTEHKWLLRRGVSTAEFATPSYLACGPEAWVDRCLEAARLFGGEEAERWSVLDGGQVGLIVHGDTGLVATGVKLSAGAAPATPVQVLSACLACRQPGVTDEELDKLIKPVEDA